MNRYLVAIIGLFSLFFLHVRASEGINNVQQRAITGKIYIDGPILYGPKEYYDRFSCFLMSDSTSPTKEDVIHMKPYDLLIKVGVITCNQDQCGNTIETWLTEKEFFPNFLPLRLFKRCDHVNASVGVMVEGLNSVVLQCIAHPNKNGTSFQDNLQEQLENFISLPGYFESYQKVDGRLVTYSPIEVLMKNEVIKRPLYLQLCFCEGDCICSTGADVWEHGARGLEVVELIKDMFSYFLFPKMIMLAEELLQIQAASQKKQ